MTTKNDTQQRIIDAAIKIFAAKGYHGTTTSEIAIEAQVAEGTIFKYFKTKKNLLKGVLEFIVQQVVPSIMQYPVEEIRIRYANEDARAIVKQLLLEKVEIINKNINCIKIMVNEIQYHDDIKNEYFGKLVPEFIKFLQGVYGFGVSNGIFRELDSHTAVRSFMGMVAVMLLDKNVLNTNLDISKELDTILDIYLTGVEKRERNV